MVVGAYTIHKSGGVSGNAYSSSCIQLNSQGYALNIQLEGIYATSRVTTLRSI